MCDPCEPEVLFVVKPSQYALQPPGRHPGPTQQSQHRGSRRLCWINNIRISQREATYATVRSPKQPKCPWRMYSPIVYAGGALEQRGFSGRTHPNVENCQESQDKPPCLSQLHITGKNAIPTSSIYVRRPLYRPRRTFCPGYHYHHQRNDNITPYLTKPAHDKEDHIFYWQPQLPGAVL